MKKVLITGASSYIGGAVEAHLSKVGYEVTVLDLKGDAWREFDFSGFDCVFHVAGIAHDTKSKKDEELYYRVNRDLAIETAQKAQEYGVKQLIFMSSMLVYNGVKDRNITKDIQPKVKGCYGDSKLQADLALQEMNSENFSVSIVRPPMIFGKDCKGNFPHLVSLVMKAPFFPKIKNQRSMLHIDNLCAIIELIIQNREAGIFFPQNPDYFCSTDLSVKLAALKGKRLKTTRIFNWLVWLAYPILLPLKKLFGNLTYDKSISNHFNNEYQVIDNNRSLEKSV